LSLFELELDWEKSRRKTVRKRAFYSDRTLDRTLHRTWFCFTTASGLGVHQRVRSFPKFFFETSNRTLHRTRPCRPPRLVPVSTTASDHPFQISGLCQTGCCQRPIVDNRTRPVIPGAYWNVTGRCLHHVRSFDHRVRSSRIKRISPFLTVRLDLDFFSFVIAVLTVFAEIPSAAVPLPPRALLLCPVAAPSSLSRPRCASCSQPRCAVLTRERARRTSAAPPCPRPRPHRAATAPPPELRRSSRAQATTVP
jgi:hypothetical protein